MSDRIIKKIKHICNSVVIASLLTIGNPASIRAAEIKVNSSVFFDFQECVQKANDIICNGYFLTKNGEQGLTLFPGENTTITGTNGRSYPADSILINDDWECPKASCNYKGITIAQGARYNARFIFKNVSLPESKIALLNIDTDTAAYYGHTDVKVRDIFIKNSRVTPPPTTEDPKIPTTTTPSTPPTPPKPKPSTTTPPTPTASQPSTTSQPPIPDDCTQGIWRKGGICMKKRKREPKVRRRTSISTNLPQVKAGGFAQLCERKQSLPVETIHTIDVLLKNVRTNDCKVAERQLNYATHITLAGKQITDLSPLSSLTKLTHIYLNDNQIVDVSPLSKLVNLKFLQLGNNQIINIESLAGLSKLRQLAIFNNQPKFNKCPLTSVSNCKF